MYGLRYVYPVQLGGIVRGIPTAVSASPLKEQITQGKDVYVWPYKKGTVRGQAIPPLYATVPEAVANDEELYKLLVIVDALRMGRAREREIAISELDKSFVQYGEDKH